MSPFLRLAPGLVLALALAGCTGEKFDDLKEFEKKTEASLPHKIDPLPEAKTYEPFTYSAFDLADPFKPRTMAGDAARNSGANAPDVKRTREPLERYPLDALKMVGILQQRGQTFALVRADGMLYRVKVGDHLGLDYGVITAISEHEIAMQENIQDANGDWSLRASRLQLAEAAQERNK